jgi:hypothetical protein
MKQIGGLMVLFGAGSFILNMLGREFSLLMWIDNWGTTTGTVIRIALVIAGAALWYVGNQQDADES